MSHRFRRFYAIEANRLFFFSGVARVLFYWNFENGLSKLRRVHNYQTDGLGYLVRNDPNRFRRDMMQARLRQSRYKEPYRAKVKKETLRFHRQLRI